VTSQGMQEKKSGQVQLWSHHSLELGETNVSLTVVSWLQSEHAIPTG